MNASDPLAIVGEMVSAGVSLVVIGSDVGYLDIFDFVPGMPDQDLEPIFASAVFAENIPIINREWLKKLKTASGRPLDLIDLENLP